METEEINKKLKFNFIIFGCLAITLMIVSVCLKQTFLINTVSDIDNLIEMVRIKDSNVNITFKEVSDFKKDSINKVTAYSEAINSVSNTFGIYERNIKLTLIDDEYSKVYKLNMLEGAFPDTEAVLRGEPYAVISENISIKLFKSLKVIGNKINIMNQSYKVIGVYESNNSSLMNLLSDGYDRVFIAANSLPNGLERPVDILAVKRFKTQSVYKINKLLNEKFYQKISAYKQVDYSISAASLNQSSNLILFIFGILALIYALILAVRAISWLIYILRDNADLKKIIFGIAVILICFAMVIYMIYSIKLKFFIPERYIPYDNIFDLNFYFKQLMDDIRQSNVMTKGGFSHLNYVSNNITLAGYICDFLILLFMLISVAFLRIMVCTDLKWFNFIQYILSIFLAGILAGLYFSRVLGLDFFISYKNLSIVACMLIISAVNKDKIIRKTSYLYH